MGGSRVAREAVGWSWSRGRSGGRGTPGGVLLGALLLTSSCGGGDGAPGAGVTDPPPPAAVVEGTVRGAVRADGAGVAGVGVTLAGGSSRTTTTGTGGSYSLPGVPAGAYQVEIAGFPQDLTFTATRLPAVIATSGQEVVVDFTGEVIRTASIVGSVRAGGAPLSGVQLRLVGGREGEPPQELQAVTDAQGSYGFPGLRAGSYVVSLPESSGGVQFADTTRSVTVGVGESVSVDFDGQVAARAAIVGTVRQGTEGLEGVTVALLGAMTAETRTDARGDYTFSALEAGGYTVTLSGFPATAAFDPVTRGTTLGAADTVRLDFAAVAPSSATVAITGITALPGGGAVDPLDVSGSFTVQLAVDPGDQVLERIEVRLGGTVAAEQLVVSGAPGSQPGAAPFSSSLVVNSAAFDAATGVPAFLNGPQPLTASVRTGSGASSSATLPQPLTLRNVDLLRGRISSTAEAADQEGRLWRGGDVTVELIPTLYSGHTLAGTDARFFSARSDASPARFPRRVLGEVNSSADPEENLVVETVLSNGTAGPTFRAGVRYESVPPLAGGAFMLTSPNSAFLQEDTIGVPTIAYSTCCRENWVGPDYRWDTRGRRLFPTDGWDGTPGVGGATTTFHAGPAGESLEELAARPAAETPREAGLRTSSTNGAYQVVARIADALGNARLVPLTDGFGVEPERFGVDYTPPLDQALVPSETTLVDRAIYSPALGTTLSADPVVSFIARDPESGVAGHSLSVWFEMRSAQQPPGTLCPFGGCVYPLFRPLTQAIPAGWGPGYYHFRGEVYNQAGLGSGVVERASILVDPTPPVVQPPALPGRLRVGSGLSLPVNATDTVDLLEYELAAEFAVPQGLPPVYPLAPATRVGTPWSDRLTTTLNRSGVSIPRTVVALEPVDGSGRPRGSGHLAPISAMQIRVRDVALNTGVGRTALNPLNQPGGASFLDNPKFDESAGTFELRVDQPNQAGLTVRLCINDDRPCPSGSRRAVPLFALVAWTAQNPSSVTPQDLETPFSGGVFFYLMDNLDPSGGVGSLRMLPGGVFAQQPSSFVGVTNRSRWWRVELKGSDLLDSGWGHEEQVPLYVAGLNGDTGTLLLAQPVPGGIILVDNQ